jgi:ribonuclease-3
MSDISENRVACVARTLGYQMQDEGGLLQACTHASRCGAQASVADKHRDANERLEFVGDALLGAALCVLLYQRYPEADEGQLSRFKARLASRTMLARAIEQTGLLEHCLVGLQMTTPWPDSVKANLMEAILAAIFMEGGWAPLLGAVDQLYAAPMEDPTTGEEDARMRLQVWCLEHHKRLPTYHSERCGGSDHEPAFTATVSIDTMAGEGRGGGRRRAEWAAAVALLKKLGVEG